MTRKYNRGISEAQSNALALERRGMPYTAASGQSFTVAWNYHNREPKDLREAVRMARAAYADEVPGRMHNRDLADDGTPKMTPQAEGYIFGSDTSGETRPVEGDPAPVLDFYRTPFRAALENLRRSSPKRAAIVAHITIGSQEPGASAITEGVPPWCAKLVAEDTLRSFLRNLTDVKVHLPKEVEAA
jgi:hypothetical protein